MKLSNIKTRSQFYDMAETQYQRTIRLRDIWQDDNESIYRRTKAFALWGRMFLRMQRINTVAVKINQYKPKNHE